jgi:hypothetical protein
MIHGGGFDTVSLVTLGDFLLLLLWLFFARYLCRDLVGLT